MFRTENTFLSQVIIANKAVNPKITMLWKPGNKWQPQMKLEGVPAIWGCNEPLFAHTHNLSRHIFQRS
jgi:hypothetical protein